jgi:hypothetical protein
MTYSHGRVARAAQTRIVLVMSSCRLASSGLVPAQKAHWPSPVSSLKRTQIATQGVIANRDLAHREPIQKTCFAASPEKPMIPRTAGCLLTHTTNNWNLYETQL